MSKPIIGIVGRKAISKIEREVFHVEDGYRKAVIKSGGTPFMILPTQNNSYSFDCINLIPEMKSDEKQEMLRILNMCDGIIMPGGCRIFEYDKFICKFAIENNIPLLGICLGMQIMASVDCINERVVEEIKTGVNHKLEDKFVHKFKVDEGSYLYNIVKNKEFIVNSKHKCNITKTNEFDIVRIFRRWNNRSNRIKEK